MRGISPRASCEGSWPSNKPVNLWSTRIVRLPLFQSSANRPDWPGLSFAALIGKGFIGALIFTAWLDAIYKPVEYIANRRLAGFEAVIAWQDRARQSMPQMPGTSAKSELSGQMTMSQVLVPMIFTKVPSWIPEPTATQMRVKGAHCYGVCLLAGPVYPPNIWSGFPRHYQSNKFYHLTFF